MAKAVKKKVDKEQLKSPKDASNIFHNIMKTSMTVGLNAPKPKEKITPKKK